MEKNREIFATKSATFGFCDQKVPLGIRPARLWSAQDFSGEATACLRSENDEKIIRGPPVFAYGLVFHPANDAGAIGTVCEPIGAAPKKSDLGIQEFFYIYIDLHQLRDWAHVLIESDRMSMVLECYLRDIALLRLYV